MFPNYVFPIRLYLQLMVAMLAGGRRDFHSDSRACIETLVPPVRVLGAGIGLFLTANWALANKLAPVAEAGKYLGLSNLATAGADALARLEGPALDWLNGMWPAQWVGYTSLFIFGAISILLSAALLVKIQEQ